MTLFEDRAYHTHTYTQFDGMYIIPGNFQIVSHSKCEAFGFVGSIGLTEFDCRWMTAKHRDTKGVNVIMFYVFFLFFLSLLLFSFNFIYLFIFLLLFTIVCCFRKISCESIHIEVWLLFHFVQNSQKFLTENDLVFVLSLFLRALKRVYTVR